MILVLLGMAGSSAGSARSRRIPDCRDGRDRSLVLLPKTAVLYASNMMQVQGCIFESTHCKERRKIFKPTMILVLQAQEGLY